MGDREEMNVFAEKAAAYDAWYDAYKPVLASEILALKKFLPAPGKFLEIGAGTGRFGEPLGVTLGVEPAPAMAQMAIGRGMTIIGARAEALPFADGVFDLVLFITTLCFVADPLRGLREATRVLKPRGRVLIGMVDEDTPVGRLLAAPKKVGTFLREARFYPVSQVLAWLAALSYGNFKTCQTLFRPLDYITEPEPIRDGSGEGYFVVIAGEKGGRP